MKLFFRWRKKEATPYLLIAPCVLLIGLIIVYPLIQGVISSFYNVNLMRPVPKQFIGLDNFIELMKDDMFWTSLQKSVVWTIAILVVTMLIGFITALLLNQDFKGRSIFRSLVMIPWLIPAAIGSIVWKWIYSEQYGLLNSILRQLHLIDGNCAWLAEPDMAFWAVTAVAIWKGIPFATIVLLAGLQAIPMDLYEAAEVDGASWFRILLDITIPQIKGIALIVAILTSIWNFNQFEIIQVITRGGPGQATTTMPIYTYKLFLGVFDISYASAMATLMLLLTMFLAYFYVKKLIME